MQRIQSKKHKLGTYEIDKILSCFDNKRYLLDDAIYTLAYFHKDSVTSCKKIVIKMKRLKKIVIKKIKKFKIGLMSSFTLLLTTIMYQPWPNNLQHKTKTKNRKSMTRTPCHPPKPSYEPTPNFANILDMEV